MSKEHCKSITINDLDADLVYEFKSFCATHNFRIREVVEIVMRKALKDGPKMGLDIHALRTHRRIMERSKMNVST